MKTYIVYDEKGLEKPELLKAGSHNSAEKKALKKYAPEKVTVAYTEI